MNSILLVEDERWVRVSIKRVIEKTGLPFKVIHECSDGLEALDWLKGNQVDLVITDVRMPIMDGISLVSQLLEERPDQDVIVISGHDDFEYVQSALRAGVSDYLLKPVEVSDIATSLNRLLVKYEQKSRIVDEEKEKWVDSDYELSHVEQVIQYIKECMPGEVTLQNAASKVHLNPSYLSQLFKQQTKHNFVDYVLQLRMAEAKKLLAKTSLRISEIAERLGYADIAYFSNTYKRITGQTPSDYRKEIRSTSQLF
jgi:two-component system, response regulator YesN